jgi:uncharacterized membrane protein YkvA (DUF1232 family)
MRPWQSSLKTWVRTIKRDVVALWIAARDPRVPWYAKAAAGAVAAYALSPIDVIPDFIPVLGYLDDLVIVPLGILLVVKLIPAQRMEEFRQRGAPSRRSTDELCRLGGYLGPLGRRCRLAGLAILADENFKLTHCRLSARQITSMKMAPFVEPLEVANTASSVSMSP